MTNPCVLFIQGGGEGAHSEDKPLAESLKRALGASYDVRFPQMPDEANPDAQSWGRKISLELSRIPGRVILAAHSIGGAILLKYLAEVQVKNPLHFMLSIFRPSLFLSKEHS